MNVIVFHFDMKFSSDKVKKQGKWYNGASNSCYSSCLDAHVAFQTKITKKITQIFRF